MFDRNTLESLSARLEQAHALKEQAAFDAFGVIERQIRALADMLIQGLGDRNRAVRWMCMHHRKLEGRNGYQVLADGEEDRLWDELERASGLRVGGHYEPS